MRFRLFTAGLLLQSLLYVAGGINHLLHPAFYTAILPPHYPHPPFWIHLTGWLEILGGIGLLPRRTRRAAAIGIIAMLLVYLDVHVSMLVHADRFRAFPAWLLLARIPLQFVLIAWAWTCSRPAPDPISTSQLT